MTMTSVLELADTVSPAEMPTETMVPLIGLVSCAAARDCCASMSVACAESMAAWSVAICSGVSEAALAPSVPPPEVPVSLRLVEDEAALGVVVVVVLAVLAPEGAPPVFVPEPELPLELASALAKVDSSCDTVVWSALTFC